MTDLDTHLKQAYAHLQQQTALHTRMWGLGSEASWVLDQEAGTLVWQFPKGRMVIAPVQIIGTLHQGVFRWAWANDSIDDALSEHAHQVYEYGQTHNIDLLTQPDIPVDSEDDAWRYVAWAFQIVDANGVYRGRGDANDLSVFMTFGQIEKRSDISKTDFEDLRQRSTKSAADKAKAHKELWQLGQEQDWSLDLDTGILTLTFPDKRVETTVQVIGTLEQDTLTWAWADSSLPPALTERAQRLRRFIEEQGSSRLTEPRVTATPEEAWEYTAMAHLLPVANGVYVAQAEDKAIYMTLDKVTIIQTSPTSLEDADKVLALFKEYMQMMYEVDLWYQENKDDEDPGDDFVRDAVARKTEIYHQFWRSKSDKWKPCSVAWRSDYDLSMCHSWQCYKIRGGVKVVYAWRRGSGPGYDTLNDKICVYKLKRFKDGYRITGYDEIATLVRGVEAVTM